MYIDGYCDFKELQFSFKLYTTMLIVFLEIESKKKKKRRNMAIDKLTLPGYTYITVRTST